MRAGATSAMYAGAMTLAAPTAMPPRNRQVEKAHSVSASPEPNELTAKSRAVTRIARTRPARSAARPAMSAPTADPRSAEATANPSRPASAEKCRSRAPIVPLTTAVS